MIVADPGAGKTTVGLHWIKLMNPSKTLVVSTKQICLHVWKQESERWVGTKHLTFTYLVDCFPDVRSQRINDKTDVHLINFEMLAWLIDHLKTKKKRLCDIYEAIIFDESSFLKTPNTIRFKKIRPQVQEIKYRIGMTGTPIGNSLLNIWGQIYLCCGEKPLGKQFSQSKYGPQLGFKGKYFDTDFMGWKLTPKENAFEKIVNKIMPYTYRIPVAPERMALPMNYLYIDYTIPQNLREEYRQLSEELFLKIDTSDGIFEVSGPVAVIQNKLRQFESGAMYLDDGGWITLHDKKIKATTDLVTTLHGEPLLIFYEYDHEYERLKKAIPSLVHIKDVRSVERWNNNEIEVMAAHPKSAGHGLNLHLGGAYNMLFFTLPWSFELWKQGKGRLDRTGQQKKVNLYSFKGPPVETKVGNLLRTLKGIEDQFMDAIEGRKKLTY